MAKSTRVNTFVALPFGGLDVTCVSSVAASHNGVMCINSDNQLVGWVPSDDEHVRRKVARALTQRVAAAKSGMSAEPIDWAELGFED